MPTNLQVASTISSTPQYVQDASANNSSLSISNANIGIGTSSPQVEFHLMKGGTDCRLQIGCYSSSATGDRSAIQILKSGSNTPGTLYRTVSDEDLGNIEFFGANTSDAGAKAAAIEVEQDGSGGATYIPGRITFLTGTNAAAAAARVVIKNDGKVGIGTTSPSYKLDVSGNARVDGSTLVVDSTNHRVGVGTTSPTYTLDVDGNASIDGNTLVVDSSQHWVGVGTSAPGTVLDAQATGAGAGPAIRGQWTNAGSNNLCTLGGSATGLSAFASTGVVAQLEHASASGVALGVAVGRVGVGTTSPSEAVEVSGNIKCGSSNKFLIGSVEIKIGAGAPSGADGAPVGSLYLRTDGGTSTTLYVKTASSTWTAK